MKKVLVVDDNPAEQALLQRVLEKAKEYQVFKAPDGRAALQQADQTDPDAVFLDVRLPGLSGMEVLQELKESHPGLPVIMLTGFTDIATAVEAIKKGAFDYLTKPFEEDRLLLILQRALEKKHIPAGMAFDEEKGEPALSRLAGQSQAIQEVRRQIRKVADSSLTVLIEGATGAGKEPTARALHEESSRSGKPFVAIDCGALPENLLESELFGHEKGSFSGAHCRKPGQIELAEGGTLFLDEIGNLTLALQAKFLRVLEERQMRPVGATQYFPIDVRFIAATNISLAEAAKDGRFRQDLYYRLAEFSIRLPSLRERKEDLPLLAQMFLEEAAVEFRRSAATLSPAAVERLSAHSWPGNVRELRNVIRQAVLTAQGTEIGEENIQALLGDLPAAESPWAAAPLPGTALRRIAENAVEEAEKQAIGSTLRLANGNKSQAAKALGVDYKTLRLKIKKYGLQSPRGK